jgi:hypothetical protein
VSESDDTWDYLKIDGAGLFRTPRSAGAPLSPGDFDRFKEAMRPKPGEPLIPYPQLYMWKCPRCGASYATPFNAIGNCDCGGRK